MKVPNPFETGSVVGDTTEMGLQAAPETKYGRAKMAGALGAQFDQVLERWQQNVDETKNRDNANELQRFLIEQKTNAETGWANLKGENALQRLNGLSLEEETSQAFKERYTELRKRCGNERQRRALDAAYGGMDVQRQQNIAAWVVQQQGVYEADVDKRNLETAVQIASDYKDPVSLESGLEVARSTVERISKRAGISYDPSIGPGIIHATNLDQMIDDADVGAAKTYLKKYRGEMSAKQIATVQKALDIADRKQREQSEADAIISKYGSNVASALKAVEGLDADIRDGARSKVRQRISDMNAIEAAETKQLKKQAVRIFDASGDLPAGVEARLLELDPEWVRRFKNAASKPLKKSDDGVLIDLDNLATSDPEKFADLDLDEYKPFLSKTDFRRYQTRQSRMGDASYKEFKKSLKDAMAIDSYYKKVSRRKEVEVRADEVFAELRQQKPNGYIDKATQKQVIDQLLGEQTGWFPDRGYETVGDREKGSSALEALAGASYESDADFSAVQGILKEKGVYGKATPTQAKAARQLADGYGYPSDVWVQATQMAIEYSKKRKAEGKSFRISNRVIQRCADHILFGNKD